MSYFNSIGRSVRRCRFEALEDRRLLATVPNGFTESVVASSLTSPITMDIEQSGRIWLAYQDGRIEVIENDQLLPTPAIQLDADGSGERGLQGLELDPDFENNGYLYVYYTAASPESHNRVSRLTVDPLTENTIIPGSELVLLDLPDFSTLPQNQSPIWHMGGAVHFLADGTLAVQIGDHLNNSLVQNNNAPMGKVLRMNTDGSPVVDNPFYDPADNNPSGGSDWNGNAPGDVDWIDYVWSSGLRNPYSGDVDPATGQFFVNDVGQGSWEEINDATSGGENFGWPTTEGYFNSATYPDLANPFYAYDHSEDCAITGGAFNSTTVVQFPAEYQGHYFFSLFCAGEIQIIDPNDPGNVTQFITDAAYPMNIEFGPDGSMYYIARGAGAGGAPGIGTGQVLKVEYAAAIPPQVVQQPQDLLVSVGYDAGFSVSAAGSNPLSYQWQRDNGGGFSDIPGATSPELMLSAVSLADDNSQYRVVVSNIYGSEISAAATLDVTSDTPPTAEILLPLEGATYRAGDIIDFSGIATDLEDGALAPASLTWQIDFHHDDHLHPFFPPTSGIAGGQFEVPVNSETASNVWFRIHLIAEDSAGLQSETFRDVYPVKSVFTPVANVDGVAILVDGQPKETPINITGVVNVNRSLEAPATISTGLETAVFSQWLDGETDALRVIATPEEDTAYVALYEAVISASLVKVNFQLAGVDTPAGYLEDGGLVYGDRGNGWDYGWSSDHTDVTRDRGIDPDQRLDTLAHFHDGADWEIDVPNGTYWVTASIGDAGFPSTHTLNVEGVSYWSSEPLNGSEFAMATHQVTVSDGRLTLDQGAAGDKETRINYLEIATQAPTTELLPFTASDVDLNGRLNLDDALGLIDGWGVDGSLFTLEERVRHGDLDFDGDTDNDDWAIFNARWLAENNSPISLDALQNPLAGDYNRNGQVTRADYHTWRDSYGSESSLAADGDGSGRVDAADYTIWRDNLGAVSTTPIVLDNLVLFVDPLTGEGRLKNDTGSTVDLVGYTIASDVSALLPDDGGWNSLQDQGVGGWDEVAPSASDLSELNAEGQLSLAPGESVHLGKVVDPAAPMNGLSLSFGLASSSSAMPGVAVFSEFLGEIDPPDFDALALFIDPTTGEGGILNDSGSAIDLAGYSFVSLNAGLLPTDGNWNSLQDQGATGWEEAAASSTSLSELNAEGSLLLSPGQFVPLGNLYDEAAVKSAVVFEYGVAGSLDVFHGVATFTALPALPAPSAVSESPAQALVVDAALADEPVGLAAGTSASPGPDALADLFYQAPSAGNGQTGEARRTATQAQRTPVSATRQYSIEDYLRPLAIGQEDWSEYSPEAQSHHDLAVDSALEDLLDVELRV